MHLEVKINFAFYFELLNVGGTKTFISWNKAFIFYLLEEAKTFIFRNKTFIFYLLFFWEGPKLFSFIFSLFRMSEGRKLLYSSLSSILNTSLLLVPLLVLTPPTMPMPPMSNPFELLRSFLRSHSATGLVFRSSIYRILGPAVYHVAIGPFFSFTLKISSFSSP